MTVLLAPILWTCPNCANEVRARPFPARFHNCVGLRGLTAPMVPAGTKAKVEVHEREDYAGHDRVTLHEGRPVMSIVTTRDDGQDVAVFAPAAGASGASHG